MQAQPLERCLSMKETIFLTSRSRSSIYAMLDADISDFPRPLKIGRRTYFLMTEIQHWISTRPRLASKSKIGGI